MLENRQFAVSRDLSVGSSNNDVLMQVYGPHAQARQFLGVEAMGWRNLDCLDLVVGIHGRIGNIQDGRGRLSRLKVWMANELMYPTEQLMCVARARNLYLLVHAPECMQNFTFLRQFKGEIRVENDIYRNAGLEVSLSLVRSLIKHGVCARFNLDLVHWAIEQEVDPQRSELALRMGIERVQWFIDKRIPLAIHFPFGEEMADSLNMQNITDRTLSRFGRLLQDHPEIALTLENQWAPLIYTNDRLRLIQCVTNQKMRRLEDNGVI